MPKLEAISRLVHTWDLMDPLEPACCMPERPADGGLGRGGVSAAFAGEVLAAELPQVLPVSSHSLSAPCSILPELGGLDAQEF